MTKNLDYTYSQDILSHTSPSPLQPFPAPLANGPQVCRSSIVKRPVRRLRRCSKPHLYSRLSRVAMSAWNDRRYHPRLPVNSASRLHVIGRGRAARIARISKRVIKLSLAVTSQNRSPQFPCNSCAQICSICARKNSCACACAQTDLFRSHEKREFVCNCLNRTLPQGPRIGSSPIRHQKPAVLGYFLGCLGCGKQGS